MKKWKEYWNELLPYEKWFDVVSWALCCGFLMFFVLDILGEFGILAIGFDAYPIEGLLIAAAQACQAVVFWRTKRNQAYASLVMAIIFGLMVL